MAKTKAIFGAFIINFTIKEFRKWLKQELTFKLGGSYFTIKEFRKWLKQESKKDTSAVNFTIKEFRKWLKP